MVSVAVALWAGAIQAAQLRAAIGLRLAPYVLDNQVGGIEYEYAALILGQLGYQLKPIFVPLKDVVGTLESGKADIALTVTPAVAPGFALSKPYVAYRNAAIVLASRHIELHALQDLKPYSIAAFDRATKYLGPEFAETVAGKADYTEYGNQLAQNVLLYQGKVDVVIADVNIFHYLDTVVPRSHNATVQPVMMYRLFPPSNYDIAFKDASLRDRFDSALVKAHQLPGYSGIVSRWQGNVGQPVDEILLEGRPPPHP